MNQPLRILTRGSDLALAQAQLAADALARIGCQTDWIAIRTSGDKWPDLPMDAAAKDKQAGLFTRELEQALLDEEGDVAVHSLKDLPTQLPDGLLLAAVLKRGLWQDALITPDGAPLSRLPRNARVGTSSVRRRCQLLRRRKDLDVRPIRGNVPTRLRKVQNKEFAAIILAAAGLERLGLNPREQQWPEERLYSRLMRWPVAAGQGIIGLECRKTDNKTRQLLEKICHENTWLAAETERALLRLMGGGCQMPLAARTLVRGAEIKLEAEYYPAGQQRRLRAEARGKLPGEVAKQAAKELQRNG